MGTSPDRPLRSGSHRITVDDGLSLAYHVAGSGPVCICHPGGPGAGWESLRSPALERRLTVVTVEPIGTGSSSRLADPSGYTLDRYVGSLRRLIEHLDAGPVAVLGHSHGGFVALRLALEDAGSLARLILYSTAARTDADWFASVVGNLESFAAQQAGHPEIADILSALDEEAGATTDEQATAIFRRQFPVYFADYWGREAEFLPMRQAVRYYAGPNAAGGPPYDVRARLALVECPTLILAGRHDPIMPPRWAEELHEGIPESRLIILEDSGHFGHVEQESSFSTAVIDFVTSDGRLT